MVEGVAAANLPFKGARLRALGAACAGGLAAHLSISFGNAHAEALGPLLAGGCLGMGVLAYWLVGGRVSRYAVLYGAALIAAVTGAFLG